MGSNAQRFKAAMVFVLGALSLVGCGGIGAPGNNDEPAGQVTLALTAVPSDVRCLQVTVTGSRTDARSFDVTPAQSTVLTLKGLPLGNVMIQENAFAEACAQVTAASVATWVSDNVAVTLVARVITQVTIVLHRNGQLVITSDFQDDPDGGAATNADAQSSGGGNDAQACVPLPAAQACGARECGSVSNGCGGTYSCGLCDTSDPCFIERCSVAGLCVASAPVCLVAGTSIAMADGTSKAIEDVAVGDHVLAYDTTSGLVRARRVEKTFHHAASENHEGMIVINAALRATGNHPVFANGRWVRADQLSLGDALVRLDAVGASADTTVRALTALPGFEETFNLEVEGDHDYFAGGVLVHNKPLCQ